MFNNRGILPSTVPRNPLSFSSSAMAADTFALLNALGGVWAQGAVHVVGLSMGGMIAQEMYLTAPSRIASLTLVATHAGGVWSLPGPAGVLGFLRIFATSSISRRIPHFLDLLYVAPLCARAGHAPATPRDPVPC